MSRLENNGNSIREELLSRNLYTPSDIYDINNPRITEALNSISRLLRPGNAFDFSNTIIGRVIGPQTPITEIGRVALVNLFTEQVKSTIVRKKAPLVNFDNLLRDDRKFISKNIDYSITTEDENNIQNKIFSLLRYGGVNRLTNPLRFQPINDIKNYNTKELSNFYLSNTGNGQRQVLLDNINNNIYFNDHNILEVDNNNYKTAYLFNRTNLNFIRKYYDIDISIDELSISNYLSYFDRRYENRFYLPTDQNGNIIINNQIIEQEFGNNLFINKRFKDIDELNDNDIVTLNDNNRIFTWGVNQPQSIRNSKGILGYTASLFDLLNNRNNAPFNKTVESIQIGNEIYYNGIRYGSDEHGIRSYSLNNQMDRISKTIKPNGYDQDNRVKSPLFKRPIPKVVLDSISEDRVVNNVMFSIENLAIDSNEIDDIKERGPNGGRILWFAPMIENFNETTTPMINTTNFLGRGEPVYTYANTERKLTVNFLMVVDHVEELVGVNNFNDFQDRLYNLRRKQNIEKVFKRKDENKNVKRIEELEENIKEITKIQIPFESDNINDIYYFFPNDVRDINQSINAGYEADNLNNNFVVELDNLIGKLSEYYTTNSNALFNMTLRGYSSSLFLDRSKAIEYNKQLSRDRSESLKNYIINRINTINNRLTDRININIENLGDSQTDGRGDFFETNPESINSDQAKRDRKVSISEVTTVAGTEEIELDDLDIPNIERDLLLNLQNELDNINDTRDNEESVDTLNDKQILKDEYNSNDNIDTFSKIKDYRYQNGLITYTPYELYKRLTFLNQCTRQGRTLETESNGSFSNAVFGKPPIIVFRLGDMYNTRAIITSITFDFENELPWDINPEGFGIQKMGCRIAMSMNLIGGSSINGPKEHILNGESRRYYANSTFEADSNDKLDREEK